jgi:large subunit ribosomal protein L23
MAEDKKIENLNIASKVLLAPWITEASTAAAELNKYIFRVTRDATKVQIKKAIEALYQIKVISVKTINVGGKKRMRGRVEGQTASYKKAIVTVKEGESIDLFGNK